MFRNDSGALISAMITGKGLTSPPPSEGESNQSTPQKSSEFVGAGLKPASTEFGVKGDKARFLTLSTFLSIQF
jgi:hypothetical protein